MHRITSYRQRSFAVAGLTLLNTEQLNVLLMLTWFCALLKITAVLRYSARRYDSAVCCSKMSRDAFPSEAFYEAYKSLEKFAAAPLECACLRDGDGGNGESQMYVLFCVV